MPPTLGHLARENCGFTWSGECDYGMVPGVADGQGALEMEGMVHSGKLVGGIRQGHWVERWAIGSVLEGPYLDGKLHGHWVERYPNGEVWEPEYRNGERVR
ncbi:MAG: hypothetical protein OXG16_09020 [Rhodospirillales bacterium]|nr:hypothetical protein [Rhodospirillales bacterium]